jgi:hypothetical protein
VSGDAPQGRAKVKLSPAENAKLNAWSTKRGLSQAQAMNAYILEADRQLLVWGSATNVTPANTPAVDGDDNASRASASASVLLTPRGLAAVPLLCAAASESRKAYLTRLGNTRNAESGWWARQEPLCADPGSIPAIPEKIVLTVAAFIERASVYVQVDPSVRGVLDGIRLKPGVVQSLFWPMHNVLLAIWMLVIFLSTLTGSSFIALKTMLLGSRRTGVSLENIFAQEVKPCKNCAASLVERHQASSVRLLGLALYPVGFICNISESMGTKFISNEAAQLFAASGIYVASAAAFWWYWFFVLPWTAMAGLTVAFNIGWCFGLIELAGI